MQYPNIIWPFKNWKILMPIFRQSHILMSLQLPSSSGQLEVEWDYEAAIPLLADVICSWTWTEQKCCPLCAAGIAGQPTNLDIKSTKLHRSHRLFGYGPYRLQNEETNTSNPLAHQLPVHASVKPQPLSAPAGTQSALAWARPPHLGDRLG